MQSSKPHIAARVRDAREWKEISQVAMAKRLDIARQTYLDLESGENRAEGDYPHEDCGDHRATIDLVY